MLVDAQLLDAGRDAALADAEAAGDDCQERLEDGRMWAGQLPPSLVSGVPPVNTGTGLADIRSSEPTNDTVAVDIDVSEVVVTATGVAGLPIWVVDGEAAIRLDDPEWDGLLPGDVVSFSAAQLSANGGQLVVTDVNDLIVTSSDNSVYLRAAHGEALEGASDRDQLIRTWGELTSVQAACAGDATCFDLTSGEVTITFRIDNGALSEPLQVGDCVEVVAPVSTSSEQPMLDILHLEWQRRFGASGS